MHKALIIVDLQNDFCPGGSLGVAGGDQIIPIINSLLPKFKTVVYTRDWHPANHISFAAAPQYIDRSWPTHCVAGTPGAAFHPDLVIVPTAMIVSKATDPAKEAYSGFQDSALADDLRKLGVDTVFICGLATDYCVKATALDALQEGLTTFVITDAVKGVDVPPGSAAAALSLLQKSGVKLITATEVNDVD